MSCFCCSGFGREILQDNTRRLIVITTEEQLQRAVEDLTSGDRIIIKASNLNLTKTLRLEADDVEIRGQIRTTSQIVCPNNGTGSAFLIT